MSSKRTSILWLVFALCATTVAIGNLIWLYSQQHSINHGDEIFYGHFFLIELAQAKNLTQFFEALWWTYIQHRFITYKLIILVFHVLPTAYFWPCYLIGALLIQLAWLLTLVRFIHKELPFQRSITYSLTMLWLLAPYAYITIVIVGMQYAYTLVTLLSLSALYCLTLKKPNILLGFVLMLLATFTFANGLLVTGLGWALLAYRTWILKDIPSRDLLIWSGVSALLAAIYLGSTNIFSNQYYGAKSLDIILQQLPNAIAGLLAGLGAIPFGDTRFEWLKILWGSVYLITILLLLWHERYRLPIMLTAALGFCLASLFVGAVFRHSAAENSAYLYLTLLTQLLTLLWLLRLWPHTGLKLFAALFSLFIFSNGVYLNTTPYQKEVRWLKLKTQKLLSEQPDYDLIQKAMFDELRYTKGITPFNYRKVFNSELISATCPQPTMQWQGGVILHNYPGSQAVKIIHQHLPANGKVLLCGDSTSWEVRPLDKSYAMLIDKVRLPAGKWTLMFVTPENVVQLAPSFDHAQAFPLSNKDRLQQCGAFHTFAAVAPLKHVANYFCQRPLR